MAKLPAFQFYPSDWRKDPAVQSLSYHDRGVWFEILCLMHESEQRGKLLLNGRKMPDDALARLLGLERQAVLKTLHRLLDAGVASRCPDSGALMNRRMVKDEELRKIRRKCGKMGGNPNLLNQNGYPNSNQRVNQTPNQMNEDVYEDSLVGGNAKGGSLDPPIQPVGPIARKKGLPSSVDEVVEAGAQMHPPKPEELCRKFWSHYEGTAHTSPDGVLFWMTKGGSVISNWRATLLGFNGYTTDKPNEKKAHQFI